LTPAEPKPELCP